MSRAVRSVVRAMQKLYPLELADSSWDNTGLLVDASTVEDTKPAKILLTIDLTAGVATEAINGGHNVIVAYHPFIFRGLKAITPQNSQQSSLLSLIKAGVSVYCPHTAVDASVGGVNDWLCDGISGGPQNEKSRVAAEPATAKIDGHECGGMGREVKLIEPVELLATVKAVKKYLGLQTVQLIRPDGVQDAKLTSFAVCAGSGGSVLRNSKADLIVTGELGHHEMLALREKKRFAIVAGHSNTERGYLATMKQHLKESLGADIQVDISQEDRDPIEYV